MWSIAEGMTRWDAETDIVSLVTASNRGDEGTRKRTALENKRRTNRTDRQTQGKEIERKKKKKKNAFLISVFFFFFVFFVFFFFYNFMRLTARDRPWWPVNLDNTVQLQSGGVCTSRTEVDVGNMEDANGLMWHRVGDLLPLMTNPRTFLYTNQWFTNRDFEVLQMAKESSLNGECLRRASRPLLSPVPMAGNVGGRTDGLFRGKNSGKSGVTIAETLGII